MTSHTQQFMFDVNFDFAVDGVFTLVDQLDTGSTPPPIEGYFLLTDNTNFVLTDGEDLVLA